jgi:tetratricopeptide (TPR) repeat protein
LAASLGKIAWVATESGQFAEAVTAYEHQVALMNEIVDRDPENRSVRRRLAMVHRLFGKTLTRTFACQQSKEQLERARIICDSLLDETPMNPYFLREQALVSVAYGQLAESINEPSEAKRHYEKAFTQINLAIDRVPNHPMYMSVKAEVLRTLSYSCLMQGMMTDSYEFATQARIMISQLIRGDPENVPWRRNLAAILEILAITSFQLDIPGAEDLAELCKDHFRTIAEAPEASWPEKCDYARVLLTIEPAFLQDPTAAMKLLQPDQGSRPENDPVYQFHMAATLHANGNTEEAIFLWDQARNSLPENSLISAESWAEKLRFPQDSP